MSDALIGLFGNVFASVVTIVVVLIQGSNTKDSLLNEIKTNQAVTNNEMNNIKAELKESKEQLKETKEEVKKHNNYGLQIQDLKTRVDILERSK